MNRGINLLFVMYSECEVDDDSYDFLKLYYKLKECFWFLFEEI